ncbi:MAG: hypothetical protein JRF61_21475 [Deltaproteobacteria bacterium]|jgi:hypothetical protein|nr:hypothetical protein [Deltaproteobacteria bacterium]
MIRQLLIASVLTALFPVVVFANESRDTNEDKLVSGMSIVGNDEAPKSLVIVPWKTSDLGGHLDVSRRMDDARGPIDREVFLRTLDYYEIRTEAAR